MKLAVYLRPLQIEDAQISYKWRNDPEIWTYTGRRPTREITPEIELLWLQEVLACKDQLRFAICLLNTNQYIGNVQLLDITDQTSELHLFIGEKAFWGKNIGYQATLQMLNYGFNKQKLATIYLKVNLQNKAALKIYEHLGFEVIESDDHLVRMSLSRTKYLRTT